MSEVSKPAIIIRRRSDNGVDHRVELTKPGAAHARKAIRGLEMMLDDDRFYIDTSEAPS